MKKMELRLAMANKSDKPAKQNKKLARTYTPEDVKKALKGFDITISPASLIKESVALWNEFEQASEAEQKQLVDKLNKKLEHTAVIYALDNHYIAAGTLHENKHRTLMIQMAKDLIAEHDCKTTTEKMLAQTAALAYCRMIEYGDKLNGLMRMEFISNEKNGFYSLLSREVDRCTRQYLTAINTLKHFKQPTLNVTFKADNAFVAQNQQINSKPKDSSEDKNNAGQ